MNVTEVVFSGFYKTQICGLYQYDYGQVLKFTDITLPSTYEVHFAQSGASTTVTVLGDTNGVQIPDQYLLADLDIKAYIYLHEEETDGETVYQVLIPVIARPEPTDVEPTPVEQDIITQTIAALNSAVDTAEGYAADANQSASDSAASAISAQAWAEAAQESAESIDMSNYATKAALQSEENARALADTSLGNDIDAEVQRATQAEASIRLAIPSKTSQLQNDSGFLTSAPVASVNGKTGAVSLSASDVGALPSSTVIPSKTSDLTNDSHYITASEAPVQSVNGMTGAVTLPTATTSANGLMSSQDKANLDAVRGQIGDLENALNDAIEDFAVPTQEAVDNWLNEHPEATTTVQDGSITTAKLANDTVALINRKGGLTEDVKQALLNLFAHVAYIDADGQTYFDALEVALNQPANLLRIGAVFKQGDNVIYDTDSLDTLKQYLTVTAYYDDGTYTVINSYTLSGTLTVGTSTITASYGGKTATFNVTVTELPILYPLENGTHTFTQNLRTLTVTDNSHFEYTAPNATDSSSPKGAYLNLSKVSENDDSGTSTANITKSDVLFTIPSGANVVFEVLNIDFTRLSESNVKYSVYLRSGSTKAIETGDRDVKDDAIISKTFSSDAPITCVCAYLRNQYKTFEADIRLTVNGKRWI